MAQPVDSKSRLHEDQEYFHGYISRNEALSLIRDPGDFLARLSDTQPSADIRITCCQMDKKKLHLTIESFVVSGKTWYCLRVKPGAAYSRNNFTSPHELIEHYRARGVTKSLKLTRAIPRPEWTIKSEFVVYNEETDEIGMGNFGITFKGLLAKKTGKVSVAIKMPFGAASAATDSDQVKEARQEILNEAKAMVYQLHVNVAQFFGLVVDQSPALVVWEWCVGGDLLNHLRKFGKETDRREKTIYMFEISRGLMHLHFKNIVHGNLSARNCLISSRGCMKIADYGHAKLIDEGSQAAVRWAAPESLPPVYSARHADTWAFGMVLYETWSNGLTSWSGVSARNVAGRIRECDSLASRVPDTWPAWVAELLKKIWVDEPEQRPSMLNIATQLGEFAAISNDRRYGIGPLPLDKFTVNKIPGVHRTTVLDYDCREFDFYIDALKRTKGKKLWDGRTVVPEDGLED